MYLQTRIVKGSLKPFLSLSFQEELADMVSTLVLPDRTSWYPLNGSLRIRASLSDWKVQIPVCYAQMHSIVLAHTSGPILPYDAQKRHWCIETNVYVSSNKRRVSSKSAGNVPQPNIVAIGPQLYKASGARVYVRNQKKFVYNMEISETCRSIIVTHSRFRRSSFDVLGLQLVILISSLYKIFLIGFVCLGGHKRARNPLRNMPHPLCYSCSLWLFSFAEWPWMRSVLRRLVPSRKSFKKILQVRQRPGRSRYLI
jgi:hypothetical protein